MEPAIEGVLAIANTAVRKAFSPVFDILVTNAGCETDVRSGYVSFSLADKLVAAAHPRADAIDLVLAIPFDPLDASLFDALDYKWRNLPAGVTITNASSARLAKVHVREAIERVSAGVAIEIPGEAYARPKGSYDPAFKKGLRHRR